MTAVVVVAVLAVAGAVVARVTWRRPADERHSIRSHQHTLDTLRSMAARRSDLPQNGHRPAAAPPRPVPPPAAPARTRSGPVHARGAVAPPAPVPEAHPELVLEDKAGPSAPARDDAAARARALVMSGGLRRPAGRGGFGRPRRRAGSRLLPVVAAVAILALLGALGVALAPSHHGSGAPKAPPKTHHRDRTTTPPRTTVTTAAGVRATTSSALAATYSAPAAAYTLGLRATGPCWIQATELSTGQVLWTGTLQAGDSQSVPANGSVLLRVGASHDVAVSLNGQPVLLPPGFGSPFDMTFQAT